jgi:hypothetical protein
MVDHLSQTNPHRDPSSLFDQNGRQTAVSYKETMSHPAKKRQIASGIAVRIGRARAAIEVKILAQQANLFFALAIGANDLARAEIAAPSHSRANGLVNTQVLTYPGYVNIRTGGQQNHAMARDLVFSELFYQVWTQMSVNPIRAERFRVLSDMLLFFAAKDEREQAFLDRTRRNKANDVETDPKRHH